MNSFTSKDKKISSTNKGDSSTPKEKPQYVCFDQLMVGGNIQRFTVDSKNFNSHAHENLFYSMRQAILKYYKFDNEPLPVKHQIVISKKTVSRTFFF
jgi:hypothetical protein